MSPHYQRDTLIGFILLIYSLVACSTVLAVDQVISEQEGKTVIVPCPVNREKCGELHSLNWFKGDNRIAAMLLDDSNVTSVAAEFEDRVSVEQNPFRLIIRNLRISDEDIYLCDTTYFIPIETCDNFNGHRVELNVLVPPTEVVILDEKGDRIDNGSIVGPIQERQILKSTCIVRNTRPQPQVGWWRGNKRLTTHSPSYDEQNGLFTATLELSLQLSRDDLGHNIECRVDSAAIPNTLKNQFSVDLQVRPTSITINGVEHHTVQGSKVVLTCDIHGARPPVNLTWYNNTQPISSEDNDISEIRTKAFGKEDGTYHTQSELIFNATRFENDMVFRCEAENIVLQINREKPFTSSMTLEVLYPPVVKVSPLDITVNTSDTVLLNCEYVANPASLTHVVWYRNGDMVNVNDTERYEGGNSENVALVIRSTDKQDIGNYSCQLSNVIGKGISEQQTDLDVQFVPIVEVLMIPEGPVKESDESNVTLFCNILDANPSILSKVRWYANSTLLKELPDCEETREDLCHIDPSKLLLESIGRGFFYNYSCEGYNAAGWGTRSDDKELLVHYEPGPAVVTHFPLIAVKKKSVTFSCSVDDPGYPESNRYRWLRGGRGPLQDVVTKDWTVEPVGLDSRTNYSCYAFNEGGKGVMATVNLEVHAPPFFIKNLPPYTGMLHTSRNANLTCRIECVPRCEISWLKDGVPIDKNDTRYFVKDKYMDASPATGDFESMLSVLHFNMSNWPNKKFDIEGDNANYTCVSTGNTVGPGIKSATYFSIEYAPDNTTVSEEVVYVQEETIPGRVICKSRANPEPTYEWLHNNKTVIRGNALIINTSMMRNDTGRYTCAAFNKHGRNTAETFIDVQYKPRCEIERREIDDRDTLICTAYGNPEEADFSWSIKAENESVEWLGSGDNKASKDKSFYILTEDYAIARTYRCVANNTAGAGQFCEVEVAEQLAWWQRWDKTTLIILVASILVLLLAVIIICCIIICICRRRRRQDKSVQEKSSSMADPLTEPGEYENLPFHGLQTAPNKFTTPTTPTNFNNNTNVVRSVPRPKRLNGNISQIQGQQQQQHPQYPHHYQQQQHQHAAYYDEQESETGQQQQQQYYHLQQQQQQQLQQEQAYNTFAKHTAQQQHQQQQPSTSSSILAGLPTIISQSNNSSTSNCNGRIMLSNAATEDGVIVHTNSNSLNANSATSSITAHNSASSITNPHQQMPYNLNNCFPKSYTEYYQTQQQQQQQQFTSKFAINNMANATHAQMLNAIEHDYNAFNAGVALVTEGNTKATNPFLAVSNFKKFNQPSSVEASTMEGYNTTSMKRIGKRKTFVDKLEDKRFYSLKFSSGGKNKAQNSKTIVTANFNSAHKKQAPRVPPTPLYINVNSDSTASPISNLERPSSPNSAVATSAYESASSSQNDGTCADPASLSSCTSLYSGKVTSVSRCSRHQQPPEITTPEEYEQYQLGHHPHGGHSSSSLSVASSVSGTGVNASAWSKCKKQQRSTVTSNVTSLELTNKYRLDTNPFLAANTTASTTAPTTICRKKLRRQTISDPYAHIKYISDCRKQHLRLNTVTASKQNRLGGINETHNYCSESTSAFKATTAAANVDKSQQQQQINLQPYNAIDYVKQSELHQSHHRHHDHPHCYEQLQQQQHQQQQQLGFTHSQHTQQMLMSSSGNIDDIDDDGNNDRPYNDRKYSPHSCYLSYSHDDNDNYNYIEEMGETAETLRSSQIMLTTDRKLPETTNTATIPSTLIDFTARPIKLPLRKYHSFHFQTSQTVAGQQQGNLKMRQQEQLQAQAYTAEHPVKHHYSKEGPLVFLPLCLNENSTFKPIVSTEESEGDDSTEISINDELEQYSKSTPIANLIRCTSSLNIKNSELNNQSPTIDKSITKLSKAFTIAKREPYEQIDKSKENTATVVKPISKSKNLLLSRIINNSPEVIKIQDFTNSNRDEIYITSKTLIRSPPVLKTKNMSTQSKGKAEASAEIFKNDVCEPNLLKSEQMTRGSPSQIGREENEFVEDIKLSSNTALFKAGSFKDDSNSFALNESKFEYNARMDVNPENKNLTFSGQCFQTLNHKKNIGKFPDASKCIDMYKVMPESLACTGSNKGCPTLPSLKSMTEDCNEKSNQTHDNTFSTRNIKSPLTPLKTLKLMTKSNPELWYNTHTGNRQKLHQLQLFHSMQNLKNSHKSNRNTSADVVDTEQEAEDEEDLGYTFYEDENDNDINDNDINDNDK
ncbi:uncharacterized protein LOC119637932 isoform X6 [Glossina fuscipes]|uniref:Uncharacterized protein LOC119637932 isoform X6 n=1 Tax=Glossina fuscipes TaxID=7396 RepID=A0A9C5Z1Q8_9MUSC|nr:uncharacterized protein LOC119637932 isoform X6 [Glossina fuscipes]